MDKKTQQAIGYLSGIPVAEENQVMEVKQTVTPVQESQFHQLMGNWTQLQEDEIQKIGETILEVIQNIDVTKKKTQERIRQPMYVQLVRKGFRTWTIAESEVKLSLFKNILINAASKTLSPDTVLIMFLDWLDHFTEAHIGVIEHLSKQSPNGLTRKALWLKDNEYLPSEDSAEADLYKKTILDLTTGHVIRQIRDKDFYGNFVRREPEGRVNPNTAFDDTRTYTLTELGKQFTSYAMTNSA